MLAVLFFFPHNPQAAAFTHLLPYLQIPVPSLTNGITLYKLLNFWLRFPNVYNRNNIPYHIGLLVSAKDVSFIQEMNARNLTFAIMYFDFCLQFLHGLGWILTLLSLDPLTQNWERLHVAWKMGKTVWTIVFRVARVSWTSVSKPTQMTGAH